MPKHPEPVPAPTQLAAMPFLSAVSGFLCRETAVNALRVTIHRAMSRNGSGYLQQIAPYFPMTTYADAITKVGRIQAMTYGIMGKACETGKIYRTKKYDSETTFLEDLRASMNDVKDNRCINEVAKSYLAVPLIGPEDKAVLVLYADCNVFNFFADDKLIAAIVAMCNGIATLLDSLQVSPFPQLRNFPLEPGIPVMETPTVYGRVQEPLEIATPRFSKLMSLNFEASVA